MSSGRPPPHMMSLSLASSAKGESTCEIPDNRAWSTGEAGRLRHESRDGTGQGADGRYGWGSGIAGRRGRADKGKRYVCLWFFAFGRGRGAGGVHP
eukprot:6206639-Pleurochrysis_carterae.AAC.1